MSNELNTEDKALVVKISESFYASLKADFTEEEFAEMKETNREYLDNDDKGICASHNYRDSNMNMFEAVSSHMEGFDVLNEHHCELWNSAWARTQTKYLTA